MGPWLHALLLRGSMSILVHFVDNNVQILVLLTHIMFCFMIRLEGKLQAVI